VDCGYRSFADSNPSPKVLEHIFDTYTLGAGRNL
jgi:hypothetical protein